jgi:hypothetical protein
VAVAGQAEVVAALVVLAAEVLAAAALGESGKNLTLKEYFINNKNYSNFVGVTFNSFSFSNGLFLFH